MKACIPALVAVLLTACGRTGPALVEFRDPEYEFTVRHPAGWTVTRSGDRWRAVPLHAGGSPDAAEFILIVSRTSEGRLDDASIRRVVFELLPIHGVSGFQQDARATADVQWYKFEVTGATGAQEWASIGAVISGQARYHVVVCAKPLTRWRDGQKQCDDVIRMFRPGPLQ